MHRHLFGQCLAAETFVARHAASSVCQGILQMFKISCVETTQDVTQETWRSVLLQAEIMAANEWFATDDQNLARFQFVWASVSA